MIVVGALVEYAANGVDPVDGGIAVWADGAFVYGIAEERITRRKYQGGFRRALRSALEQLRLGYDDVDAYSFVSYGEPNSRAVGHIVRGAPELSALVDRVHVVGTHHEAHALGAATLSPWNESLVVIYDNEGLVIGPQVSADVTRNPMERASYYLATSDSLDLLTRDLYGRNDVSLGEAYRRFSYYAGFPSHQFAGKTMALAAYGDPTAFGDLALFTCDGRSLEVDLGGSYDRPAESVVDLFARHGHDVSAPRRSGEEFHEDHLNAAALIQSRLETATATRIGWLLEQTGQEAICFSGGVAYNCRLVAHLEDTLGVRVFVPPSPGDQGIGVGAALLYVERRTDTRVGIERIQPIARLGGETAIDPSLARDIADRVGARIETTTDRSEMAGSAVTRLLAGGVVAVVEGKSEFGRRALGARSLLAMPSGSAPHRLRELKHREWFRPFGASMLESLAVEVFDRVLPDPFMLRAPRLANTDRLGMLPHVDKSLRAQLVGDDEQTLLADILRELVVRGFPGVVVNTSFNLDGAPLVETEREGLDLFADHAEIDLIILAASGLVVARG